MSKDIRLFFSPLSEKKPALNGVKKIKDVKKNVRKRALIESDSEDESSNFTTPKKSKKKEEPKKEVETSKYFNEKPKLFFGSQPVKQIKPVIPKVKNEQKSEKEKLLDMDDDIFNSFECNDTLLTEIKTPTKPSKNIETQSPKKLSPVKRTPSPKKSPNGKKIRISHYNKLDCVSKNNEISIKNEKTPPKKITEILKLKKSPTKTPDNHKKNVVIPIKFEKKLTKTVPEKVQNTTNSPPKPLYIHENTSTVTLTDGKKNNANFELWVDKYRPQSLKGLIGQQGEKSVPKKLLHWLKNWNKNHSGNQKHARPGLWAKDYDGAYFKASLLSGPPGIGKTTTAHLVCKELNMDFVEYNASCTRSKKMLHDEITELLTSRSLSDYALGGSSTSKSHVLIMDEVDGMAGNEDRGGIQELISLIKNSKVPIICMCNDRNHPKIRSLSNYCFDLRVNRPRVEQIKGAMLSICFKEGLKIPPNVLNEIINSTNQDIRLVLNNLSMLSARNDSTMNISAKDLKLGAWDVARKVFSEEENKKMTLHDKCDLFFNDYSIAPLFIQENYLNVVPHSEESKTKIGRMKLMAKTATSLCYGDLVDHGIRTQNAWSLLPTQAIFSSVIPGATLLGHVGGMINFPSWFGKNSKKNKMDRICQEIQVHSRLKTSSTKENIATDYSYALKEAIVSPLVLNGTEGTQSSLNVMREYMLLREDLDSLIEITTWPDSKNKFADIDSKVKSAFTRAYNKCPVLTPCSLTSFKKVKGSVDNYDDEEGEFQDDEETDDINDDGMILKKKAKAEASLKKLEKEKKPKGPSTSKPRGGKGKKK